MRDYAIKDFELGSTKNVTAQGVAEAIFEYLPWPSLDVTIKFRAIDGWTVIDNNTDFKYEVSVV